MKRIRSACLEQTLKFENESDLQLYLSGLARRRTKYRLVDRKDMPDRSVVVKIIRDYNNYPLGEYLD